MPPGTASIASSPTNGSGERTLVAWGALCLFLVGWATVSVTNASETLFLKQIGVDWLPLVFLVSSGFLAGSTYLLGKWVASRDHGSALTTTLAIAGGYLLLLWLALITHIPGVLAVLVMSAKQIQGLALLVFWVAVGGWLDGRQAKRLIAPMMAGGTLGAAFGSFASSRIGDTFGIPTLVLVASASMALATLSSVRLRQRSFSRLEWSGLSRRREAPTPVGIRELWTSSGLFRRLASMSLLSGLLAPILYFEFSAAADAATRGGDGEQELLALYGSFRGWMNMAVVGLQIGGTSWLFSRIGVPRAALSGPLI